MLNSDKGRRYEYCFGWFRDKTRPIRFGFFMMIIALLWLGRNMGWIQPGLFGPAVMIITGIWIMVVSFIKKNSRSAERS